MTQFRKSVDVAQVCVGFTTPTEKLFQLTMYSITDLNCRNMGLVSVLDVRLKIFAESDQRTSAVKVRAAEFVKVEHSLSFCLMLVF